MGLFFEIVKCNYIYVKLNSCQKFQYQNITQVY